MQYLSLAVAAAIAGLAAAECPNACSGHGTCGEYDSCVCFPNWQSADCSERTCQFGTAHVDTAKGDLDGDRTVEMAADANSNVVVGGDVYAKGTSEVFPHMFEYVPGKTLAQLAASNTANANYRLSNTAHDYMECSNKGLCNREVGECECFAGYEGAACQRASCPNDCSGHGVCKTISALEDDASGAPYTLWDKDMTMGCSCDGGWTGADCSSRQCPTGVDPLYLNGNRVHNFPSFVFKIPVSGTPPTGVTAVSGEFAITFYDKNGRGYTTDPISVNVAADSACAGVLPTIKALPNSVVADTTTCAEVALTNGMAFALSFPGNPGYHPKSPEVIENVNSGKASSMVAQGTITVAPFNSMVGEDVDYFATECSGVTITAGAGSNANFAGVANMKIFGLTDVTAITGGDLLKTCLGDNDNDASNNVEVQNWDHGSIVQTGGNTLSFPTPYVHLVRLVKDGAADGTDGSQIVPIWYTGAAWKIMTPVKAGNYRVFYGSGIGKIIHSAGAWAAAGAADDAAVKAGTLTAIGTMTATEGSNLIATSVDLNCDHVTHTLGTEKSSIKADATYTNAKRAGHTQANLNDCVKQGDFIMLADVDIDGETTAGGISSAADAQTNMLYKVKRAFSTTQKGTTKTTDPILNYIELDHAAAVSGDVALIKFTPHHKFASPPRDAGYGDNEYAYTSECSGRGVCNGESGLCQCFKGYYMENCDLQSALAI